MILHSVAGEVVGPDESIEIDAGRPIGARPLEGIGVGVGVGVGHLRSVR
ncbi:MAG: hypothetical protein ACI8RC_001538 [Ilumatobacter sp.]|jgi:hypothetical protein